MPLFLFSSTEVIFFSPALLKSLLERFCLTNSLGIASFNGIMSTLLHNIADIAGFEIIHGCMSWEAELGPITKDEKKVTVGSSHW